eukprot:COSAG02_NODE_404_length_23022_cov_305.366008_8_plen_151_part_00
MMTLSSRGVPPSISQMGDGYGYRIHTAVGNTRTGMYSMNLRGYGTVPVCCIILPSYIFYPLEWFLAFRGRYELGTPSFACPRATVTPRPPRHALKGSAHEKSTSGFDRFGVAVARAPNELACEWCLGPPWVEVVFGPKSGGRRLTPSTMA